MMWLPRSHVDHPGRIWQPWNRTGRLRMTRHDEFTFRCSAEWREWWRAGRMCLYRTSRVAITRHVICVTCFGNSATPTTGAVPVVRSNPTRTLLPLALTTRNNQRHAILARLDGHQGMNHRDRGRESKNHIIYRPC